MNVDTRARRQVRRVGRIVVVATLLVVLALSQSDVARGGLNGDGNTDVVFTNWGQTNRRCLGDGAGGFLLPCTDVSADTNGSSGVALGDLNDDGNADAVFANSGQTNRRCLADGAGGFACADVSADTNLSSGAALGDLNSDGNLDAVFANWGQTNRRCLGDGAGGFACADVSADTNVSYAVALIVGEEQPPAPHPIGGIVVPVNKLELLAPWLGLVTLAGLAAVGIVLVRRRRRA